MSIPFLAGAGNRPEFELTVGPHGAGELGLLSFDAREELSRPFSVEVTFVAGVDLDLDALEGQKGAVKAVHHDEQGSSTATRFFSGIVEKVERLGLIGHPEKKCRYRLRLRPELWRLDGQKRSRVFPPMTNQPKTAIEIVELVLKEYGLTYRGPPLQGRAPSEPYPKLEYSVQYKETDLEFVSRLLEEEGVFYFFEHAEGGETLVLGDSNAVFKELPGGSAITYLEDHGQVAKEETFIAFATQRQTRPSAVVLSDVNYLRPTMDITAHAGDEGSESEVYEHHGRFDAKDVGQGLARIRLEQAQVKPSLCSGRSTSRRLCPGFTFKLEGHPDSKLNGDYLVVSVRHRGDQPETLPSGRGKSGYTSHILCLRLEIPYRPERRTPRPSIAGWQTALVVGPGSEEIHTDQHGRVKVQFHWDRAGAREDNCCCWVRVAQALAGPGFGAFYLPRVGQEVVVSFEDGDPDRPLVIGATYNGLNVPPLDLPAKKSKSTLKTISTPGGSGFNELCFEDAAGSEEVFLHAQKDLRIEVLNDKNQTVGGNEKLVVEKDRSRTVNGFQKLEVRKDDQSDVLGNQSLHVAFNRATTVGLNHTETVGQNQSITVGGAQSVTVGLASVETVGLAKMLSVGGAYLVNVGAAMNEIVIGAKTEEVGAAKVEVVALKKTETVGGNRSLQVAGNLTETVLKKRELNVQKELTVGVGTNLSQTAKEGYTLKAKRIEITAEDECALKVGSASLVLKKNGEVQLNGNKVMVNGTDSVVIKSPKVSEN